jgi:hypothetical protein
MAGVRAAWADGARLRLRLQLRLRLRLRLAAAAAAVNMLVDGQVK